MLNRYTTITIIYVTIFLSLGLSVISCSHPIDATQTSLRAYHNLIVSRYRTGFGPYGVIGVSSLKINGYNIISGMEVMGGTKYDPTPKKFTPGWFASTASSSAPFPMTIEATWCIYEEERVYHTFIKMPSYNELDKIISESNKTAKIKMNRINDFKELKKIGLAILFDMPPQVKVFVFLAERGIPGLSKKYYLIAQGMGEAISANMDEYAYSIRQKCREGFLSEKVCNKYQISNH